MSITTTGFGHRIKHWDGPVMAFTNSASDTLKYSLTDRLEDGPVVIVDADGSLTRHYSDNPDLAPDGWHDALIYNWCPLDAIGYETTPNLVAHALLSNVETRPQTDYDRLPPITRAMFQALDRQHDQHDPADPEAMQQLSALLRIGYETDASLEHVMRWSRFRHPQDIAKNLGPRLDTLIDRYQGGPDGTMFARYKEQFISNGEVNSSQLKRFHNALSSFHIDNLPSGTTRGFESVLDAFTANRRATYIIAQNHERSDQLKAINAIVAAHLLEQLADAYSELRSEEPTPEVLVTIEHQIVELDDTPAQSYVPRTIDTIDHLKEVMVVEIDS